MPSGGWGEIQSISCTAKRARPAGDANDALPGRILELRDKGFFGQPKTSKEVQKKLESTYPCELNRVTMALRRLNERKKLRKASKVVDEKKQDAYVW